MKNTAQDQEEREDATLGSTEDASSQPTQTSLNYHQDDPHIEGKKLAPVILLTNLSLLDDRYTSDVPTLSGIVLLSLGILLKLLLTFSAILYKFILTYRFSSRQRRAS